MLKKSPLLFILLTLRCSGEPSLPVLHLLPSGAEEAPLAVGRVSRMGFVSTCGERHAVRFAVPDGNPKLCLACASPPASRGGQGHVVAFHARLASAGVEPRVVLDETTEPGPWIEKVVDLTPYAGRKVQLLLSAEALGPSRKSTVYWGTPVLVGKSDGRPNVLLISIDSLRADHLGCYGYHRDTSPTLDSLASRGCLFERAIAQSSWTLPSHTSLLSSLYLRSHGVGSPKHSLGAEAHILPEILRCAGYQTAAFVSGGPLDPCYGLNQGFDFYDGHCATGNKEAPRNACTNERVIQWLRTSPRSPFFLFVHYWDVHQPYTPPAPYNTRFANGPKRDPDPAAVVRKLRELARAGRPAKREVRKLLSLYDGEIAHTDRHVGLLLDEMVRLRIADRTAVIVTSDHGDEFLDHGETGHGHSLFQELIHVPLIWVEPEAPGSCRAVPEQVELVDVAPTILDFLGLDAGAAMEGRSFLPLVRGGEQESRPAFSEIRERGNLKAVLLGNAKLVLSTAYDSVTAYDLGNDPGERHPVAPDEVQRGVELSRTLSSFVPPGEWKRPTLEIRIANTGLQKGLELFVESHQPFAAVRPHGLEENDSLHVTEANDRVVLIPSGQTDDLDGLSLDLPWLGAVITVGGTLVNNPIAGGRFALGEREVTLTGTTPFRFRCEDRRLQGSASVESVPTEDGPKIYLWTTSGESMPRPAVPATLPPELEQELRALGYLR